MKLGKRKGIALVLALCAVFSLALAGMSGVALAAGAGETFDEGDLTFIVTEANSEVAVYGWNEGVNKDIIIPASVTGGDGITYKVTEIRQQAFGGRPGLQSVTIPDSVTTISNNAFDHCTGLTSITIPASVTYLGGEAFAYCSLANIKVLALTPPENAYRAFFENPATAIYVPYNATGYGETLGELPILQDLNASGEIIKYNVNDIAIINGLIDNNGLQLTKAPADGGSIPEDWAKSSYYINPITWRIAADGTIKRITGIDFYELGVTGAVDLSGLTELTGIRITGGSMTSINVTGLTGLRSLIVDDNSLSSLDLRTNTQLVTLFCSNNNLTTLDLTGLTELTSVVCYNNFMPAVRGSGITGLQNIEWRNVEDYDLLVRAFAYSPQKLTNPPSNPTIDTDGSWGYRDGKRTYTQNGKPVTGWLRSGTSYYYFDSQGYMVTGRYLIDGKWYEFHRYGMVEGDSTGDGVGAGDGDETAPTNVGVWTESDGKWTYSLNGQLVTGWKQIDGEWYYLRPTDAIMHTGWLQDGSTWYYLHSSGVMATGLQQISNEWHEFNSSGAWLGERTAANTGWRRYGQRWAFQTNGRWAYGWKLINGDWYYFDSAGYMATGWLRQGSTWYYMKPSGVMATGWLQSGRSWYYMHPDGKMATGWVEDGAKWYFLNKSSGVMQTGWLRDGSKWYYLNRGGDMRIGWLELPRGTWYYLKSSGAMAANETLNIDGTAYRFNSSGKWIQ